MTRRDKWVDPAPLEVARPRLPWWTLLPRTAKLVLTPVALVLIAGWVLAKAVRVSWYYPVTVALSLVGVWMYSVGGWVLGGLVLIAGVGSAVWWWRDSDGFHTRVWWVRTEVRRASVYAVQWRTVMRLTSLDGKARGREYLPRLRRTRSDWWRDTVHVRMVKGQAPEQWETRASGLAHAFDAQSCRVRVTRPGSLALDLVRADPLAAVLRVPALVEEAAVDLRRVTIGRTETGKPWRLKLLGGQHLVVGVQGAGKGSVLWSTLWGIAPLLRAGGVRLVGIDPKGGMELGQAPELFDRLVFDNGPDAVEVLEGLAGDVRERAGRYRGVRRWWSPDSGEPFTLLVVDELADLIAYQPDRKLRERAQGALQTLTSQGRAPGFGVLGLVQDPRKEIVPFRNLFTTRTALRLDEAVQVDMVLGDGVRARGANAHEISEHTPGVAWVKEDGRREPVRARAFYPTDGDLVELRHFVTGTSAAIVPFPDREVRGGEAA
ncbi:FtsK/SpoIIIE domain-containing protein [Actinokineospora spheciospongiae]|uniref:FtsK/SpoIIIE domain-containing protein n=1 Tax=Actinokineospora spheciospongiae TaxID=909613 RepID=UPI000D71BD87|nr:FtsK/SpoIIIE domain-containing protein [Actinokineospora spheciospongiae]PWW62133.1 S-DNA-T family DNA segregation ATPase FtsK/SpoIIIE [Actinokineospora spheciospongiae]